MNQIQKTKLFVVQVFFSLVSAADCIAEMTPFLQTFSVARGAAKGIFAVIDRLSRIDPINDKGDKISPSDIKGEIEFRNVCFSYPSRCDIQVVWIFCLALCQHQKIIHMFNMMAIHQLKWQFIYRFFFSFIEFFVVDFKKF